MIFRSVLLALKAGLLNLLSIGASFGVLVAVVQWGWLGKALKFPTAMPVTGWVPLMMFSDPVRTLHGLRGLPGLRIREAYDAHRRQPPGGPRGADPQRPGRSARPRPS